MRLSIFISFYIGRAFFSIQSSSVAFNLTHLPPVDNNRKFNSGVSGRLIFQGLCAGSMMDSYHLNCHHFKHLPASRQAKRQVAWFGNLNGKGISVRGHSGKRDGITKHGHLAVVSNWTSTRNEHFEIAKETRTCSGIRKTDGNCICSLLGFVASRWRLKSVCFSPPEAYDGDCQDYMEKKYQDPNSGSSIGWRGHEISFGSTDITTAHNTGLRTVSKLWSFSR